MSSWGDFSAFAKAAKSTVLAAQKKIDSVLDIQEEEGGKAQRATSTSDTATSSSKKDEDEYEENESAPAQSSASFNKLQEDFFAAFGLSTAVTASSNESTLTGSVTSKSDKADGPSSKHGWKSLLSSFATSSSAPKGKHDDQEEEINQTGSSHFIPPSEYEPETLQMEDASDSTNTTLKANDLMESVPSDRTISLSMDDRGENQLNEEGGGGWCSEPLVVPTSESDPTDLLLPAETSPLFHTNAHLSFVGEDEQDGFGGAEDEQTAVPSLFLEDEDEGPPPSPKDTVFDVTGEPFSTDHTLDPTSISDPDQSLVSSDPCDLSSTDTGRSAESLVTVIHTLSYDNNPMYVSPKTPTLEPSSSMPTFDTDRHLSVLMDSIVTSSSDSNERSVATIMGAEDDNPVDDGEDDDPGGRTETATGSGEVDTVQPFSMETSQSFPMEFLQSFPVEDALVENAREEERMEEENGRNEFPCNVEESFVQLAGSDSGNEHGCAESNDDSGHSPTQPATCGKSSGEGSADELIDDGEGEAATTCSDVDIISTPPYDTVSERSSRSGILSRTAVDWSFHPPKPYHATKENGSRKQAHRRAGSDQSLASCESVATSAFAVMGISRSASFSIQDYEKKVTHLTELLEARERKLLDIAKENAQLADENEQLRSELQQLHSRISRDVNADAAQKGLSERLNSIERKYDSLCKERDGLKRKCDNLEKEVASRITPQQLKEKEDQIADLMAEGEKLSKQELKQGNIIKKLREKEKELEKQLDAARSKLKDMDQLKQKLKDKDEQEIKYDEMVHELRNTVTVQDKSMGKLRSELEDARDKCASYKATLENCARELAELNQEKATKEAEIERLLAKAAESKENELQNMFDEAQQQWQSEKQSLIKEIQGLRTGAVQDSEDYQRREQSLRWDVSQLRQKLQETEERNHELAESITTATKPLLRQLDSMQLSFRTQQANWERVEKSLYERISEAEKTAAGATEKEREAQMSMMELRSKLDHMEKQMALVSKEKNKLESSLATARGDAENVERLQVKYTKELQSQKTLHQQALESLNKDKELISAQFEYEKRQMKSQFEARIVELNEKVNEKERLIVSLRQQMNSFHDSMQRSMPTTSAPMSQQLSLHVASESPNSIQGGRISRTHSTTSVQEDQNQSLYDTWPNDAAGGGYAIVLERLRSRLQQREGELTIAKDELRSLQQHRDALAVQLITLSNSKCELEQRLRELESIRNQYTELDEKYQGLLLLYGEQIERNEELQMDLQDIKQVYKEQLDALLQRSSP